MKTMRQWKLEGEALARLKPAEAKVDRLHNRIEKLQQELDSAIETLSLAIYRELGLKEMISFKLDSDNPDCFIIDEVPTACPSCGQEHDDEEEEVTHIH